MPDPQNARKVVFVSYTKADESTATHLATALMASGIDTFFAPWDIAPGDSVPQRVFDGLGRCDAAVFLISKASLASAWVRDEQEVGTVLRIEKGVRVVAVRLDETQVPTAFRHLRWLMGDSPAALKNAIEDIVRTVHGVSDRPPLADVPEWVKATGDAAHGLSALAVSLARYLVRACDDSRGHVPYTRGDHIASALRWTPTDVNRAVAELDEEGLVTTDSIKDRGPFDFRMVRPRPSLFVRLASELDYEPAADLCAVAAAVSAVGAGNCADAKKIVDATGVSPGRVNRAVEELHAQGVVRSYGTLNSAPFTFHTVMALPRTALWVDRHAREAEKASLTLAQAGREAEAEASNAAAARERSRSALKEIQSFLRDGIRQFYATGTPDVYADFRDPHELHLLFGARPSRELHVARGPWAVFAAVPDGQLLHAESRGWTPANRIGDLGDASPLSPDDWKPRLTQWLIDFLKNGEADYRDVT